MPLVIWSRHPDPDNNDNLRCDHHREQDFAACLDSHALPVTGLDLSRTRLHLLNDICRQISQVNQMLSAYPLRSRQTCLSIPSESTDSSARLPFILVDTAGDHRTNHDLSKSDAPHVGPVWSASRRIPRRTPLSTASWPPNREFQQ